MFFFPCKKEVATTGPACTMPCFVIRICVIVFPLFRSFDTSRLLKSQSPVVTTDPAEAVRWVPGLDYRHGLLSHLLT